MGALPHRLHGPNGHCVGDHVGDGTQVRRHIAPHGEVCDVNHEGGRAPSERRRALLNSSRRSQIFRERGNHVGHRERDLCEDNQRDQAVEK